jgi:hypothetical protein
MSLTSLTDSLREVKTAMGVVHDASLPCMSGKKLTLAERARLIQAERDLSNSVHSFAGAIQYCETFVKPFDVTRLKRLRSQLKDRLTDDPFPGPYDAVAQNRATVAFRNMRDELTRLSFGIIHR